MLKFECLYAPVVELADTLDLGSSGRPWGFKSLQAHHNLSEKGRKHIEIGKISMCFVFCGAKKEGYTLSMTSNRKRAPTQLTAP